jgi:uncharacterized protein (TIGR02231 family)
MHRSLALAAILAIVGTNLPAQAAAPAPAIRRVAPAHRITAVTVYPDRALVTRTAHLDLVPGDYVVSVANLPVRLEPDSVRTAGRGTAAVVLHGLDVKRAFSGESPQQRLKELSAEQQKLQDQDRSQQDRRHALERQMKLLEQLSDETAPNLVKQLGNNRAKLGEWQDTLLFLQARQNQTAVAMQQVDVARRQIAKQLQEVNAKLSQLNSYRQTESKLVPINLEVTKAGGFDLELTYAIPGAGWVPSHEAQLQTNGKQLSWRAFGMITNQTGEDWNDVSMKLSTARPAAGGSAPTVPDWVLTPMVRYENQAMKTVARPAPPPGAAPLPRRAAESGAGASADEEPRQQNAVTPQARMEDQGTSVTLALASKIDVPSDGQPHQAPIGAFDSPSENRYRCVPRYSEAVYLDVEMKNKAAWPLLRGAVRTYIGTTFVGISHLPEVISPEQKLELGMGVDEGMTVKRTRTKRQMQPAGLLFNQQQWQYEYKLVVTNNKATQQTVTIVEPYPRAENDRVKVVLSEASPEPEAPNPLITAKRLTWPLMVPAHGKKEIVWGYQVGYPKELAIFGLE